MDEFEPIFSEIRELKKLKSVGNRHDIIQKLESLKRVIEITVSGTTDQKSEPLGLSHGIPFHEAIQNLEPDIKNWGCARTGFIYKRREPERSSSFPASEPQRNLAPVDAVSSNCLVDVQMVEKIQNEKLQLRKRLEEITDQIRHQRKQL